MSTWSFWASKSYGAVADGGGAATAANIESYMNALWLTLVRGPDKPTALFADNNYYNLFWQSQQAIRRIMNEDTSADDSFQALRFQTAKVYYDGGIGGYAGADHMYFTNGNYQFFRPHKNRNFVPIGGVRESLDQDAMVKFIGFCGNMTMSGGKFQGVLIA